MISQNIAGRNRLMHFGVVLGLGAALTAAACSGSGSPAGRNPAGPSAVEAPASLDDSGGGAHRHLTATVSPASVPANTAGVVLTVTVTNCGAATLGCTDGASTQDLGRVEIVVPANLAVTAVGNFSGDKSWATTWVSGQTVHVGTSAGAEGTKKLTPGQSVTFNITVTTGSVCGPNVFADPRGAQDTLQTVTPNFNFIDFYGELAVETTGCVPPEEEECSSAAPSVAAQYLNHVLNIKPNTEQYDNIIAQVTAEMGPGNDFQGLDKCDEGYADAVIAFVDSLLP